MTQNERRSIPIWKKLFLWLITIFVFAVQILLFVLLFQLNFSNQIDTIIYILIEIVAASLVMHIIHKPIQTSYKLTWSILILLLPLPFSFLYYLNHQGRSLPRYKQKKINDAFDKIEMDKTSLMMLDDIDLTAAKVAKVIISNASFQLYSNTKYTFLSDGAIKFLDMMEEMKKAEKYIFIETFIISNGYVLDTLLPVLKEKGASGVEIKIIYDDLGSKATLKPKSIDEITKIPNCQITNYNPLGLNINPGFNYRDHRKITIIDGRVAYCGGDNYADEYVHKKERFGFWRDNCGKYEGDAVNTFILLFIEMWYMSSRIILDYTKYMYDFEEIESNCFVIPFGDGPSNNYDIGYDSFRSMFSTANKTLYISTPYLVIDDGLLNSITLAARSGVDVRILMPGIPDKKSAFYLARANYREILKAGGKIYEYTKGFNHAKNIIVDNKYAFIGTINLDYRSMFLHYECGAFVFFSDQIKDMQQDFLEACSESKLVTYEEWKHRPWYQKLIAYIFYLFAPMF